MQRNRPSLAVRLAGLAVCASALAACALGTTRIPVECDALAPVAQQRAGRLLVRPLADARAGREADIQGTKRNGLGMPLGSIGVPEGRTVSGVVTDQVASAIRHAGYDVTVADDAHASGAGYDAVVEGDIRSFWLDLYVAVWHEVDLDLRVVDPSSGAPRWSGNVKASETNALWLGIASEFETVVREATTKAMDQTAQAFASEEVAAAVRGATP